MTDSYHDQMETMFGNWTTGDLIFGGAARCAAAGGLKGGSLATTVINANAGNAISFDCLSSAQICTFNPDSLDVDKEFTDCPSQPDYVAKGCSGGNCGDSEGTTLEVN
ncbi:MAG: hypothetical protein Q9225_006680, partial [Loekoesia sp. 1 TL-2023]